MTAMDIGSGMGYFTIPMSMIVGETGNVIAVDLQPEMLTGLRKKAEESECNNVIFHQCGYDSLNIARYKETVDFALIFMMLHEVPDAERLIREVYEALRPGGKLLFAEPVVHVGSKEFERSLAMIRQSGLVLVDSPRIAICRSALMQKIEGSGRGG
jgi:ubiquinone/menaquinone biosynthesis C-methylase UbiE